MIKPRLNKLREDDMFYEWFYQKNVAINKPKFSNHWSYLQTVSKQKKTMVIDAVLSPTPCNCAHCGSTVIDAPRSNDHCEEWQEENYCPLWRIQPYVTDHAFEKVTLHLQKLFASLDSPKLLCPSKTFDCHSCQIENHCFTHRKDIFIIDCQALSGIFDDCDSYIERVEKLSSEAVKKDPAKSIDGGWISFARFNRG